MPTDIAEGDTNLGLRFDDAGGVRFGIVKTALPRAVAEPLTIGAGVAANVGAAELPPPPQAVARHASPTNAAARIKKRPVGKERNTHTHKRIGEVGRAWRTLRVAPFVR
jgi:hypothetical protein